MTTDLLDKLFAAARAHGEQSEPDHEVGDLREVLASCWCCLTPDQRRSVYDKHQELVAEWVCDR